MIKLRAPYPTLQTMIVLPNPQFGDSEAPQDKVDVRRAMDGTMYSYVHSGQGNTELDYELNITRMKALELSAFLRSYQAFQMQLTDHLGKVWLGTVKSDVVDLVASAIDKTKPGGERATVRFQFEGVLQT